MTACGGCKDATSLELGARGTFEQQSFRLVGSIHVVSRAGGHWQEWRAALDGGGEAWIAESAGTYFWMREGALGDWDELAIGAHFPPDFVVVERGEGARVATAGDLESMSASYRYVDLSGPRGAFASIDYGDPSAARGTSRTRDAARTFVGRRVTLAELGLAARAGTRRFIRAEGRGFEPVVAPGTALTLGGDRFTALGALARSNPKEKWHWEEYLLWNDALGARWLVLSDGHWNLATAIEAGDVREEGRELFHEKKAFRRFAEGAARVDAAVGEFPWEVRIGQRATTTDWVHAPNMVSREATDDEVAWTLLTYLEPKKVARALGVTDLPKRHGRAPNQPK